MADAEALRMDNVWLMVLAVLIVLFLGHLLLRRPAAGRRPAEPPVKGAGTAFLEDLDRSTGQDSHELSPRKPVMLGRIRGQDSKLQYITVSVPTVGRQHAMIQYAGDGYWLVDKGSRNGSFVNGERVSGKVRLKHGDVIKLYKYSFRFVLLAQAKEEGTVWADPEEDAQATQLATPADPSEADAVASRPAAAPPPPQAPVRGAATAQRTPGRGAPVPPPRPPAPGAGAAPDKTVDFLLDEEDKDVTLQDFIDDELVSEGSKRPVKKRPGKN